MSSVGGQSVFSVRGPIPIASYLTTTHQRPGVAGHDVHDVGWGGEEQSISFIYLAGAYATAAAARLTFMAMQGSTITIIDDAGTYWYNLHVAKVIPGIVRASTVSAPSGYEYSLEMSMIVRPLALAY